MIETSVLVVDDDPAILSTVSEILNMEGYRVRTAANGAEALDAIAEEIPALVLLDMRMPVMDGWGLADQLKQRGISVPVLVMTAAQNARGWAEEINAQGFLPKPFDLVDLLQWVEYLCQDR